MKSDRTGMYQHAYIGGTFDLFNYAHKNLIENAYKIAHRVTISLNTDEFATRYKRKPVMTLYERMMNIQKLTRHEVIVNIGNENSKLAILISGADVIIHGDDWPKKSLMKQMGLTKKWLKEHKINLVQVPYTKGISTTEIIRRIKNEQSRTKS